MLYSLSVEEHSLSKRLGPREYAITNFFTFIGSFVSVLLYVLISVVVGVFLFSVLVYIDRSSIREISRGWYGI